MCYVCDTLKNLDAKGIDPETLNDLDELATQAGLVKKPEAPKVIDFTQWEAQVTLRNYDDSDGDTTRFHVQARPIGQSAYRTHDIVPPSDEATEALKDALENSVQLSYANSATKYAPLTITSSNSANLQGVGDLTFPDGFFEEIIAQKQGLGGKTKLKVKAYLNEFFDWDKINTAASN
jgi:hypothetical protein